MILYWSQIRITPLHVQPVLIDHVVAQQPVGRAIGALGIAEGELHLLDGCGQGDRGEEVVVSAALVVSALAADEVF